MNNREVAPIEVLRQRLDKLERLQMVENMKNERWRRGIPRMLQELGDRNEWRAEKILYKTYKM